MKFTVYFNGQFWVGIVEEIHDGKLRAGRYVFGPEPRDQEVFEFVNRRLLDFINGLSEEVAIENHEVRKINPKRLARQISREIKTKGISTYAQAALQLEYEKRKKEKQILSRNRRKEIKEYKREVKLKKAKEKRHGR